MTNKEYVIREHINDVLELFSIYGSCALCRTIGCAEYCNSNEAPSSCKETLEAWLNMEHKEPPLFPIGTPVEVDDIGSIYMAYYNGCENGKHYVVHYKHQVGLRYKDGELYGAKCSANQLKKVGES